MKKNKTISRLLTLVLLLAFTLAPHSTLPGPALAQNRNINVNELLDFHALGIDNETRQIVSLSDLQVKFFKRGAELREKSILSPRDPASFSEEADKRKADLVTLKNQFQSLINKLKQKNLWDETLDAQFLASLKSSSDRSVLSQAGGARKVLQAAADEVGLVQEDIDDEVRQVKSRQTGALRNRRDRVFAAHASPPYGKAGCNVLFAYYLVASLTASTHSVACAIAKRYNDKGCGHIDCG